MLAAVGGSLMPTTWTSGDDVVRSQQATLVLFIKIYRTKLQGFYWVLLWYLMNTMFYNQSILCLKFKVYRILSFNANPTRVQLGIYLYLTKKKKLKPHSIYGKYAIYVDSLLLEK